MTSVTATTSSAASSAPSATSRRIRIVRRGVCLGGGPGFGGITPLLTRAAGARPDEEAREKMRRRARVQLGLRRGLLREIRREPLVEQDDRHVQHLAEARGELLARTCLV